MVKARRGLLGRVRSSPLLCIFPETKPLRETSTQTPRPKSASSKRCCSTWTRDNFLKTSHAVLATGNCVEELSKRSGDESCLLSIATYHSVSLSSARLAVCKDSSFARIADVCREALVGRREAGRRVGSGAFPEPRSHRYNPLRRSLQS